MKAFLSLMANPGSLVQVSLGAAIVLFLVVAWAREGRGEDWPQWRGAQRDGVWRESGILEAIPEGGVKMRWRARIRQGYAGPAVAGGKVFVTDRVPEEDLERVLCFDEATGALLWEHAYACAYEKDMEYGNGPRATPTVAEDRVYTLGTLGHLFCLDAGTGEVHWKKDLVKEYEARVPRYGVSAAPLVEGELLIVIAGGQPDATVIGFDRVTGEERWKANGDRPAYSAPVAVTAGGCRQVIAWTAEHVVSLDPATGRVYWEVPFRATFDDAQVVTSPVRQGDRLLCLAAWGRGSFMLELDREKPAAEVEWKTRKEPTTMFSTPIFRDEGHFFATLASKHLACLDAASGEEIWKSEKALGHNPGSAHLTPNGEQVFLFDQNGHLILMKLTREGYEERGKCLLVEPTAGYQPQGPVTWAHPAYANRCVYARNDRELVCASLSASDVVPDVGAPASPGIEAEVLAGFTKGDVAMGLAVSPDGRMLAGGMRYGVMSIRDLATGEMLAAPAKQKPIMQEVAFSPDGALLVLAGGNEFFSASNDYKTMGQVTVWDVRGEKARGPLEGHGNKVLAAVFSPDGKTIATGSADRTVRLWDVAAMKERALLEGHAEAVTSLGFSPDGETLISADRAGVVRFWDPVEGASRGELKGHDEEILALAIAPDGKTFVTGSSDWTARLWELETREARALFAGHGGAIYSVAFSPDGKTLATGSGDESVKLWDVETREAGATLRGHGSGITAAVFTPDGDKLISAGWDDSVRMWELAKRE